MTRVLLADVARSTGLSISTVSRALADTGDLRDETRERVRRAAASLGYASPESGRRRRPTPAGHIDLVLGDFGTRWSIAVVEGMRDAAAASGLDLVLTHEREDPDEDWPARVRRRGSAGVVLGVLAPTVSQIARVRDLGIPIVLLDPPSEDHHGLSSVGTTDGEGAAQAAAHLAARGAQRFLMVLRTPAYRFGRARARGFTERLHAILPDAELRTVRGGWSASETRRAIGPVLAGARREGVRLGVFTTTDELAVGVYAAAADNGLRIPHDLLVVGFDDLPGAEWMLPSLTTVRQPISEMTATAVALLADTDGRGGSPGERIELPTTLVVRDSTGGAAALNRSAASSQAP